MTTYWSQGEEKMSQLTQVFFSNSEIQLTTNAVMYNILYYYYLQIFFNYIYLESYIIIFLHLI